MDASRRAAFLLPLSLVGCKSPTRSPESTANEFIDRYYIERNHDRALEVTSDGAAERIRKEKELLTNSGGSYGIQPRVFYKLKKEEPHPGSSQLTYELTIDSSGVQLKKQVLILVRKVDDGYRVVFFDERDETQG